MINLKISFRYLCAIYAFLPLFCYSCIDSAEREKVSFMSEEIASIKNRIHDRDMEIIALKRVIEKLKNEVEGLNFQLLSLKGGIKESNTDGRDPFKTAYLTPDSDEFKIIKHPVGSLAFILADVKPHRNGSKVTLKIGNPLSSDLVGPRAVVTYGPPKKNGIGPGSPSVTKKIELASQLRGGTWTDTSIILTGYPPEHLGYVKIEELSFETLMLLRPKTP